MTKEKQKIAKEKKQSKPVGIYTIYDLVEGKWIERETIEHKEGRKSLMSKLQNKKLVKVRT